MNDFEITREKILIRTRPLKNGNQSIYLEMHHEGRRSTECLHLYLVPEESDKDRKQNELTMLAAQHIRAERYGEAARKGFCHSLLEREDIGMTLVDYIHIDQERCKKSMGSDVQRGHTTLIYWIDKVAPGIRLSDVNRIFALKLRDTLANTPSDKTGGLLRKSTISHVFGLFGSIMQKATEEGKANFRQELLPTLKGLGEPSCMRQALTYDELQKLVLTPCNDVLTRSVFLFSCATGLRWGDIKNLRWRNIVRHDDKTRLEILQSKTKRYVYVPLNKLALSVLPKRKNENDLVFSLSGKVFKVNCHLHDWITAAGIDKHITFYCARHTFATLQYELGASLSTTRSNLGHCDIASTIGYTQILEGKKRQVIDNINRMFEERMKKRIVWSAKPKR